MGKLVLHMFMTLDGVIQAPGGLDEDREGGFGYGGWQAPYGDVEAGQLIAADYAKLDALLLGRWTFNHMRMSHGIVQCSGSRGAGCYSFS